MILVDRLGLAILAMLEIRGHALHRVLLYLKVSGRCVKHKCAPNQQDTYVFVAFE